MKVMIIPEDFKNDHYILKPLFSRLFRNIRVPSVQIQICNNPRLRGVAQAMDSDRLAQIVQRYGSMMDAFVLCVDRDGVRGRRDRLDQIEKEFGNNRIFLAENAWEELETWVLAGVDLPRDWRWADVRAEVDVKERYFEPLADLRGLIDSPGGRRETLGQEASRRIVAIRQKCPEDFDSLARRMETAFRAV